MKNGSQNAAIAILCEAFASLLFILVYVAYAPAKAQFYGTIAWSSFSVGFFYSLFVGTILFGVFAYLRFKARGFLSLPLRLFSYLFPISVLVVSAIFLSFGEMPLPYFLPFPLLFGLLTVLMAIIDIYPLIIKKERDLPLEDLNQGKRSLLQYVLPLFFLVSSVGFTLAVLYADVRNLSLFGSHYSFGIILFLSSLSLAAFLFFLVFLRKGCFPMWFHLVSALVPFGAFCYSLVYLTMYRGSLSFWYFFLPYLLMLSISAAAIPFHRFVRKGREEVGQDY